MYTAVAEVDIIRKEYGEAVAAYGCLGVLQLAQGTDTFHYLVLITDCQSVGKVTRQPHISPDKRLLCLMASTRGGTLISRSGTVLQI